MKILFALLVCAAAAPVAEAVDVADTRMLFMPAIHGDRIAFQYDNDLWLAARSGGSARRLTQAAGIEQWPRFSPDGKWLAFSADYGDNLDVYVMPAQGGEVRRLTWQPGLDIVRGFSADGSGVLFESSEGHYTTRLRYLYTVPVDGSSLPQRLPVPSGAKAAFSPDGKTLAYTPNAESFQQWKNYRGGTQSRIWLLDLATLAVTEVSKPTAGSNDTDPMWVGDTLYFNSDRNGEFNLFRYNGIAAEASQLTEFKEFPLRTPVANADGLIVFEHGGYLYQYDSVGKTSTRIVLSVISDLGETRTRLASDPKWLREAGPAPDLKRIAFNYRGEIVTVPADKGDPRQLTRAPGSNEHSPAWSRDGKRIAWFSDAGGEYALHVSAQADGRQPRRYPLQGAGAYSAPLFSPDGSRIAFQDNSQSLWVIELGTGKQLKIASEPVYSPLDLMTATWSPDSRWLAYTVQAAGLIRTVYAWSAESGASIQMTDGLSEMVEPAFDPDGEFLYVLASTDAGPLKDWFSQNSTDSSMTHALYAITLRSDGPNPAPPQSDEVDAASEAEDASKEVDESEESDDEEEEKGKKSDAAERAKSVRIDSEGLADRIVALPAGTGTRRGLKVGASGEIYFLETVGKTSFEAFESPGELKRFSLEKRETKTLAREVEDFHLSADGKRIAYRIGSDWFITDVADELPAGKGRLALDKISVAVEPRAEWAQILDDAWRINRDYFYADNFHGADWPAMRNKYRAFLPHLATRADLDRVIQMMLSELSVGHSYLGPGDYPFKPKKINVGMLGADYEIVDGRYRLRKVLGGLNWNPDLRAPLRTPGVEVKTGEYILAIDGVELQAPTSIHALMQNRAGRQVVLRVGPRADGGKARDVVVVPVDSETNLRYLDWVESNLRYVSARSKGRLAYVHVPNTAEAGHASFKRYFYPQSDRAGIILDERFNGGGLIADYYIDILRRPFVANWTLRYGQDLVSPRGAIFGPKVMITDETAGSGGDLLPWMFKRFELGPVVGKRTWGGLVGILGFPSLMDGGSVTAPNLAIWTEDGFSVENEGVAPDVVVEQWPAEVAAGRDPQLDRAIALALEALDKQPPTQRKRPDFPVRAR